MSEAITTVIYVRYTTSILLEDTMTTIRTYEIDEEIVTADRFEA